MLILTPLATKISSDNLITLPIKDWLKTMVSSLTPIIPALCRVHQLRPYKSNCLKNQEQLHALQIFAGNLTLHSQDKNHNIPPDLYFRINLCISCNKLYTCSLNDFTVQ